MDLLKGKRADHGWYHRPGHGHPRGLACGGLPQIKASVFSMRLDVRPQVIVAGPDLNQYAFLFGGSDGEPLFGP